MGEQTLNGCRILIVEDEYFLADDLTDALADAGAMVLGPVGDVDGALTLVAAEDRIDVAVLDINLHGEMVFPVADALADRAIPFVFATGYDRHALPERFASVARIEKPLGARTLEQTLAPLIARV